MYGHETGDFILVSIANIMKKNVREQDTVSRWGGEEFLIFVPETNIQGAFVLAEKIRTIIEKNKFVFKGVEISSSMTFGISEFTDGIDIDYCINNADKALYKGKKMGKNRVIKCTDEMAKAQT
jgi:diguanylate cyclase (GGDEF)-like protein